MNQLKEMINKILIIPRKIEIELDDTLPYIYSYAANYAENFAYDNRLEIDSYDLKTMINKSFSIINNSFLPELNHIISEYINILINKINHN